MAGSWNGPSPTPSGDPMPTRIGPSCEDSTWRRARLTRQIAWLPSLAPFRDGRFLVKDGAFGRTVVLEPNRAAGLLSVWECLATRPLGGPLGTAVELATDRAAFRAPLEEARSLGPSAVAELLLWSRSAALDSAERLAQATHAATGWLGHTAVTLELEGLGVRVAAVCSSDHGGDLLRDALSTPRCPGCSPAPRPSAARSPGSRPGRASASTRVAADASGRAGAGSR